MSTRGLNRALLVGGIAVAAAGVYVAHERYVTRQIAEVGIIALIAVGLFCAASGAVRLLQEDEPRDPMAATRARVLGQAAWRAVLPPVFAGAFMLTFFGLTDRWERLDNPVASQIALVAGLVGAAIGILADRITRWDLVIVPVALLVALIGWGDRLPLDSDTTSSGEIVVLLSIVVFLAGVAVNLPQIVRGRRRVTS